MTSSPVAPSPRVVVVTGATRGIGRGLAEVFLARGCSVAVCGRDPAAVDELVATLSAAGDPARVLGRPCDVANAGDVQALWDAAVGRFGRVDLWINNAGTANPQRPFGEQAPAMIDTVVRANLLGSMHGARVALAGMQRQGSGAIYFMEGYGSDGEQAPGMALYGATKYAIRYLTRALVRETRGTGVLVGSLSPGVVHTDLVADVYRQGDPARWRRQRWLFKFIADEPEPVCTWLVDAALANRRHGARLAWMTVPKAIGRFLQPRYHRRDLFADPRNPD